MENPYSEFTKVSEQEAKSSQGFSVHVLGRNTIEYAEKGATYRIAAEPMALEKGFIISKKAKLNTGFEFSSEENIERIFRNATRGLQFLGYNVSITEESQMVTDTIKFIRSTDVGTNEKRAKLVIAALLFVMLVAVFLYMRMG